LFDSGQHWSKLVKPSQHQSCLPALLAAPQQVPLIKSIAASSLLHCSQHCSSLVKVGQHQLRLPAHLPPPKQVAANQVKCSQLVV
jgi:hypothetical protein